MKISKKNTKPDNRDHKIINYLDFLYKINLSNNIFL